MVASSVSLLPPQDAEDENNDGAAHVDALVALAVLAQLYRLATEAQELVQLGVRKYLTSFWNYVELLACVCVLVGAIAHFMRDATLVRSVGSVAALLLWVGIFRHFSAFSSTGALVRMIEQILVDMVPFLLILSAGIGGFGFFFLIHTPVTVEYDHEVLGVAWPFVSVFLLALGEYDPASYADALSLIMLLLALLFTTVLLLNLLIAIMSDSYEQVKEVEIVEARQGRARLIVEHEQVQRADNTFPRFMHMLRATEGSSDAPSPWEGVAGKMKQVEAKLLKENGGLRDQLSKQEEKLTKENAGLRDQLIKQEEKLSKLDEKLDALLKKLDK